MDRYLKLLEKIQNDATSMTKEDWKEFNTLAKSNATLAEKGQEAVEKLKTAEEQLSEMEQLKSSNQKSEAKLLEMKISTRASEISSWLEGKEDKEIILKQLGEMDDSSYKYFIEGKTNDEIVTKVETPEDDGDTNTDKKDEIVVDDIIKGVLDKLQGDKDKLEDNLIPPTETGGSKDMSGEEDKYSGKDDIEDTIKLYKLDRKQYDQTKPDFKERAGQYLENYAEFDNI